MITVRNLNKVYDETSDKPINALRDVNFDCQSGKIYGLLGANGAGKSTCVRILSGLTRPTSGTVTIGGVDVAMDSDFIRSNLGYVSIATQPYDRLTPFEFVRHFANLSGVNSDQIDNKIQALFQRLEIDSFQHRYCGKLSNGMKQRVSLARALIHDPSVVILDEPFNGLDVVACRATSKILQKLRANDRCILISTHTMHEAERLCDSIMIIDQGQIIENATFSELCSKYGEAHLEDIVIKVANQ